MSEKNVNTTKNMSKGAVLTDAELKRLMKKSENLFGKQKQVKFTVPRSLERIFGKTLLIGVNGVQVNIPIDGQAYSIPEVLAIHGQRIINNAV